MYKIRKICLIFTLVIFALFISGCQESDKSKYEKAQLLMSKGEYIEAAGLFDELGAYEESSKLSGTGYIHGQCFKFFLKSIPTFLIKRKKTSIKALRYNKLLSQQIAKLGRDDQSPFCID